MKFKRILIRGADTVGSFVLSTPFYRELRKNLSDAYIVLCVKPLVYDLVKECPYVNKIIVYDCKTLLEKIKFISYLRKECFDTVFLISGSFESAFISFFAGIKNRIGYAHDYRKIFLTEEVVEKEKKHYVDYILYILQKYKFNIEDKKTEIYIKDTQTQFDDIIKEDRKILGVNFTVVGENARNWPKEYCIEFIKKMLYKGFKVILFGTKNGIKYSNYVASRINDKNFINLIGKTSLKEFVCLVKRCDIYVSVDTGGIHIANALGVKTVGLYVPGSDFCYGIRGENAKIISHKTDCSPCNQNKMKYCTDNKCMKLISTDEVVETVENMV